MLKRWWEWQPYLPHSCPLEHRHFTSNFTPNFFGPSVCIKCLLNCKNAPWYFYAYSDLSYATSPTFIEIRSYGNKVETTAFFKILLSRKGFRWLNDKKREHKTWIFLLFTLRIQSTVRNLCIISNHKDNFTRQTMTYILFIYLHTFAR